MSKQHEWSARFRLESPPEAAFVAFTPAGEREWAPGWDPVFRVEPDGGDEPDGGAPGTVFETAHGPHRTIWLVTDRRPAEYLSYARVTPGVSSGTVTVRLTPVGSGACEVEVGYRMTALGPGGEAHLAAASSDPDTAPSTWRAPIEAMLRRRASPPGRR